MNFITKLLLVAEKNTILVVCDRLSKMAHFVAIIEETLVEKLVMLFRDNMWKLHRLLESIISERELQFVVELIRRLNGMFVICQVHSSRKHIPIVYFLLIANPNKAYPSWQSPYSQHTL